MESGTFYCRSATLLLAVMPPFAMQPIPYAFARLLIISSPPSIPATALSFLALRLRVRVRRVPSPLATRHSPPPLTDTLSLT